MIKFGNEAGEVDLNKFWEKKGTERLLALAEELSEKFNLDDGAMWIVQRIYEEATEMRQREVGLEKLQEIEDMGILKHEPSREFNPTMSFKEAVDFLQNHSPVTYSAYSPGYLGMIKYIEDKVVFLNEEGRVVSLEEIDPSVFLLDDWKICAQAD